MNEVLPSLCPFRCSKSGARDTLQEPQTPDFELTYNSATGRPLSSSTGEAIYLQT